MPLKPTFYDFSLNDGTVVQVTRNFAGLYMLKAYSDQLYAMSQTFNRSGKNYVPDDLDNANVIYSAYVTALLVNNRIRKEHGEAEEPILDLVDFYSLMPTDSNVIANILTKLFGEEKKRADSGKPFNGKHKNRGGAG